MVTIEKQVGPVKFYLKFFERHPIVSDAWKFVLYSHLLDAESTFGFISKKAYTLQHDLTCSEEEILGNIKSRFRTYIRNAEKRGITFEIEDDYHHCVTYFNEFARRKKLVPITVKKLESYGDNIVITKAVKNNQTLALHINIIDAKEKMAMLLHSASERLADPTNHNLVGIANKYLHYQDMLYFKKRALVLYDFGGYGKDSENKEVAGIAQFKKSFGGRVVKVYSSISVPYWTAMQIFYLLSQVKIRLGSF